MNETAIVGIIVAGVVGPALSYLAGWWADRRRFRHERHLRAGEDLVARIDDVAAALEDLGAAAAELRQVALAYAGSPERTGPLVAPAEDAYQRTRASIARLAMRPHAGEDLIEAASAASGMLMDAIRIAREAVTAHRVHGHDTSSTPEALGSMPGLIESGYETTTFYQQDARATIAELLGTSRASRRLTILGHPMLPLLARREEPPREPPD